MLRANVHAAEFMTEVLGFSIGSLQKLMEGDVPGEDFR